MKGGRKSGEASGRPARGERTQQLLEVGDDAPDFSLSRWDGEGEVELSSFEGEKPVVLIFGAMGQTDWIDDIGRFMAQGSRFIDPIGNSNGLPNGGSPA